VQLAPHHVDLVVVLFDLRLALLGVELGIGDELIALGSRATRVREMRSMSSSVSLQGSTRGTARLTTSMVWFGRAVSVMVWSPSWVSSRER
jgi:hypothetical protein